MTRSISKELTSVYDLKINDIIFDFPDLPTHLPFSTELKRWMNAAEIDNVTQNKLLEYPTQENISGFVFKVMPSIRLIRNLTKILSWGGDEILSALHPKMALGNRPSDIRLGRLESLVMSEWRSDVALDVMEISLIYKVLELSNNLNPFEPIQSAYVGEFAYIAARNRSLLFNPKLRFEDIENALKMFRSITNDNSALMWSLILPNNDETAIAEILDLACDYNLDTVLPYMHIGNSRAIRIALENNVDPALLYSYVY